MLAPAAVMLVASSAGAQQMTVSGGLDPGSVVRTQLEHLRFRTALPFDVQFFVRAPIDADVEEVQGKVARKRGAQTCEAILQAIPTMPPVTSYRGPGIRLVPPRPAPGEATAVRTPAAPAPLPPPVRATAPRPGSAPGWLGYAAIFVDNDLQPAPGRVFELSVPALKPRKDYCFGFVLRIATDIEEARALVVTAMDAQLRQIKDETSISDEDAYDDFRQKVIAALDDLRAAKEKTKPFPLVIEVPEDSWFNRLLPRAQVAQRYRIDFLRVLAAQRNRSNLQRSVRTRSAPATEAVLALQQDAGFVKLMSALRERASNDLIAIQVARFESLLDLGSRSAELIALGSDGDLAAPLGPVTDAWTASAIDPRVTQLDRTIREIASFVDFATSLSVNAGLRTAAGVQTAAAGTPANANAMSADDVMAVARQAGAARTRLNSLRGELVGLRDVLAARTTALAVVAEQTAAAMERDIKFSGTTLTDWRTRATAYISADVGLAYSEPIDSFFFYLGTNFYLGPVNKKAPLSFREDGFATSMRKRFAVMLGIPINGFDDTATTTLTSGAGVRLDGVIGSRPLLLGAGFRINDFVRFTGGSVFFKVPDPNPLVSDPKTRHSAFFAISVDWDVRGMFGGLSGQTPTSLSRR
jgi:hypothetical protein